MLGALIMSGTSSASREPELLVERLDQFTDQDLNALCEATDAAIIDGGGFGWVTPPGRRQLETYFRGVLLVPERDLFVARLNGDIVGSAILVRPPRNNEAQAFAASLMHSFIAPYARGHGLARMVTEAVEDCARELGYQILNLDVRDTQTVAIRMYESYGYIRWGEHPEYALVRGKSVKGYFFYKRLRRPKSGGGQ
ncbi:N-acetyltransferase family protein [Rhodopila sp.]|uniref:GNAT family N-acetyltransferase n=1 Tax=Rhodopila sp. TaxID=2480087 RepID=UPI003D0E6B12